MRKKRIKLIGIVQKMKGSALAYVEKYVSRDGSAKQSGVQE